jgi:hypothetical protein
LTYKVAALNNLPLAVTRVMLNRVILLLVLLVYTHRAFYISDPYFYFEAVSRRFSYETLDLDNVRAAIIHLK